MAHSPIIQPDEQPAMTEKQRSMVVKVQDLPPCVGNPKAPCSSGITDFTIKGYDDKHRCRICNELHIELVMEEAGESAPNSEPQFVAAKLDRRAQSERAARIDALNAKLAKGRGVVSKTGVSVDGQTQGPTGIPVDPTSRPLGSGEAVDMRDAMAKDQHGTREEGISADERRRRIMAKYGQRTGGSKMG